MNQLARETSPYLLQHKDNPVDWHVWSEETLAKARDAGKPILLSVGYSACHWCHVMAHESFEDPETARLMNANFISVKVDREERPDVDALYQNALAMMGQSGGWPLTMFLTGNGEPFWGGTYFPPEPKYGRPAFRDLLKRISEAFQSEKATVEQNTSALRQRLTQRSEPPADTLVSPDVIDEICRKLVGMIDPVEGGFGQAPKFPQSPLLAFLWRGYKHSGDPDMRDGVLRTLERMSQGGIYDHLGGGYARYSTDNDWLVPHFEKMLYDNAQLVELLTWAWQETKQPLFAERVSQTIDWMLRDMRVEGRAFAAAFDADSEHEEGKYYVWTAAEVNQALGEDAALFRHHYDVHRIGNWEGKSILNRSDHPDLMDDATEAVLASARAKLLALREQRVPPLRDHKVLADWNGLAISSLCLASGAFDRPEWLEAARQAYDFVLAKMQERDGSLCHSWCEGRTHPGLLDDYAAMCLAALALYQSTGMHEYLDQALRWIAQLDRNFEDFERGGYFLSSVTAEDLFVRLRNAFDNATPSGNGMMVEVFAQLYHLTGNPEYQERADKILGAFIGEALRNSVSLGALLSGMDTLLNGVQIVLCEGSGLKELLAKVNTCCVPNRTLRVVARDETLPSEHPAHGKTAVNGRATAYVCSGPTCSLPITDPAELMERLTTRRVALPV